MKSRPILFNSEMVRALLNDAKTQTRRIIKGATGAFWDHRAYKPILDVPQSGIQAWIDPEGRIFSETAPTPLCPYGQPGDRLWVKETWRVDGIAPHDTLRLGECETTKENMSYRADMEFDSSCDDCAWTPSIHMPFWASRITLEITAIRVERLRQITGPGAAAEGYPHGDPSTFPIEQLAHAYQSATDWYRQLWESIYGPGSWDANPWVWVVEFQRVEAGK